MYVHTYIHMCTHVSNIICTHTIDFHGLFSSILCWRARFAGVSSPCFTYQDGIQPICWPSHWSAPMIGGHPLHLGGHQCHVHHPYGMMVDRTHENCKSLARSRPIGFTHVYSHNSVFIFFLDRTFHRWNVVNILPPVAPQKPRSIQLQVYQNYSIWIHMNIYIWRFVCRSTKTVTFRVLGCLLVKSTSVVHCVFFTKTRQWHGLGGTLRWQALPRLRAWCRQDSSVLSLNQQLRGC